ncbi:hypothetical protein Dimus_030486, partial [Dionaea muscipula]
MWSYDSAKHRDLRVRSVVKRVMREGLCSVEADLGPDMTEVTDVVSPCEGLDPIENFDPDLKALSDGLSLTMEAALPDMSPVGFEDRGCEESLGMTTISETLSDGVDSEKREADLSVFLSDESITDGVPEKRVADDKEPQDSAVGSDIFPSPCFPVSAPYPLRFADSKDRGCGVLKNTVGVDLILSSPCSSFLGSTAMRCSDSELAGVGASECQATSSPMVFTPLCSRSQRPSVLVCAEEKGTRMVGGGVEQLASVAIGVGGDDSGFEVKGGVGGDAMELPTETICSILPTEPVCPILPCVHSLLASAVDTDADGFVREEVRVSSTARGALRPQPTDGLWQPPSSPVEPVSEGVEKDKGIHGGAFVAQEVHGGVQVSRSYDHVVHADRRADVELSFIPPADGGNSITMEESDGDAERWGSCLLGYFLQGSLPFGYVRSSVSRQWMKLGLTE